MVLTFMSKPCREVPPTDEPPKLITKEEQILLSIDKRVDESLEATRRILDQCKESKEAGIQTLVMLDEQGGQLDTIDAGIDRINTEMCDAEKNLEDLEKCCGLFVLPWKRRKNFEKNAAYSKTFKGNEDGKVNSSGPRQIVSQGDVGPGSGYIQRILNDAREDEMEENLQQVSTMIGNLRNMACDIGNEIDQQNIHIAHIKVHTDTSEIRIRGATARVHTLL